MTLGSTALHLWIAEFKFTHNFIICDQLPDTALIFGIDIQKKFSLSYAWDKDKNCYIQWHGKFLAFTHANTRTATIGTMKSTLKIPPTHNGVLPIKISGPSSPNKWHTFLQMTAPPKVEIQTLTSLMAFTRSRTGHLLMFLSLITPINTLHFTKENTSDTLNQQSQILQIKGIYIMPTVSHWRKWCPKPLHLAPLIHHNMNFLQLYKKIFNCYHKSMIHNSPKTKQK